MRSLLTRVACGVALSGMVAGLTVGTVGDAAAATACRVAVTSYPLVRIGSHGKAVGAVECALQHAGYHVARNQTFSRADAAALASFQRHRALPWTGHTDARTWAAIVSAGDRPVLRTGSRGAGVARLQLGLRALGHRELPGTTYFGPKTAAAVKSLQRSLHLRPTGVADAQLWWVLQHGAQVPRPPARKPVVKKPVKKPVKKHRAPATSSAKGRAALAYARKQLGEPYRYGAAGPRAWDCSGLTMMAWRSAGVGLPHSAKAQYRAGRKVAKADLAPGDLVFFYSGTSHVALYAGHGMVLHASRPGKPVAYIKMSYMPYAGARRPA